MSQVNPTIIAGTLDDSELLKSVQSLVAAIDRSTQTMASSFDNAISRMTESLKKFSAEQSNAADVAKRASKERITTYDQEAQAMQRSIRGKNKGYVILDSDVEKGLSYVVSLNRDVNAQMDEILRREQAIIDARQTETQIIERQRNAMSQQIGVSGESIGYGNLYEMQKRSLTLNSSSVQQQTQAYSELEHTIANMLGIRVQEVNLATNMSGAYNTLSASLKQMVAAYHEMTASDRSSAQGKELADNIQRTQKAIRDIQTQMNRPISLKSVLDYEPKTLDDIQYKLQQISALRGQYEPQSNELKKLNTEYEKWNKVQREALGQNSAILESNNALARSFNYMKNRLAFYFTIGASTQFVKQLIEIRGQYEMTERALGILVDSAERGSEIFRQLSDMALVSPYTLIELSNAAKQLTAYDVAAKDVVDTTRRLADMSAAVGAPIERLTYALGQIKAYGYLNSRDARMFANAGIPLVKQLSEYYTELEGRLVTTAEVYDRIKKKAIDYNTVMQVINKMTDEGGKFFDFQAKMADTLKVQLANLTLAWNNMLNDIGRDQQGIITYGIKGLKELFLNWRALDSAIRNVAYTFGTFKAYQAIILLFSGSLKTSAGWAALVGQRLTNLGIAIGKTAAALATNPVTWIVAAVSAFISLLQYTSSVREETRKLNEEIANGAKEAADAINKYISSDSAKNARNAALSGSLTPADAKKTWEGIREQIELSSKASDVFIAKLLEEEDLNKRVTKAFDVAEKIRDAQNALSDLENELKVHQDSWANGLFGEGLAEDIEDFANALENNKEFAKKAGLESWYANNFIWTHGTLPYELKEATSEIEKFATDAAEVIRERLGKEGVKDAEKVTEAVARIVSGVEAANPKIRGAGKLLFETMVDQAMSNYFGQQFYDSNTTLYRRLFDQIKKDSGSLFTDLDDRFLAENARWDDEREKAIRNAGEKIKKDLPEASRNAIDEILRQLNTTQFRLNIVASIGQGTRSEFQKTFDERSAGSLLLLPYRPSAEENLADWTTKQQQAIKKNDEEIKKYARDNSAYAKQQKQSLEDENELRKQALDLFNQLHQAEKSGSKKDPLGDAFTKEVQVIGDITKRYKEYQQMGVAAQDAIRLATDEYGNTLARLNAQLGKYGIATKTSEELASMDIRGIRDYYKTLLEGAKNTNNAKGIEALEKALAGINVEITKLDYKKITDGLNNELSKLKDEYELAVELDANPELADSFAQFMGLDESALKDLPRTFNQVLARLQNGINDVFSKNNIDTAFDLESLLEKDTFDKWVTDNGHLLEDGMATALNKIREYANKLRLDENKKTAKEWSDLLEKYADFQDKLAKISKETAQEQFDVIKKFGDEKQIADATDITNKIKITQDPNEIARLQKELADLLKAIVEKNPNALKIANAITNEGGKRTSKAEWEEFQNSDLYQKVFQDMDRVSSTTIRNILSRLDELKDKVKEDPASMKALIKAYEDAEKELEKRRPFETIITSLVEWKKATKDVIEAKKALKKAQKDGDTEREAEASEDLANAQERQRKAGKQFVDSLNNSAQALSDVANLLTQVTDLLGIAEDSEAGQMVNGLVKGFQTMATVLGVVASAALLAQMSLGWVALVAAALSALVGLLTFISNRRDNQILRQIKASEDAVKRLELAYKDLLYEIENAYGTGVIGAQRLAVENKKLQLAELERQLALQEQRRGKKRDSDAILSLQGQIKDLRHEIEDDIQGITENLLGISSVGDAIENMVGAVVNALRTGDNAIQAWNDSIDDMIANMIIKFASTNIIGPMVQRTFDKITDDVARRGLMNEDELGRLQARQSELSNAIEIAKRTLQLPVSAKTLVKLQAEYNENAKRMEELQTEIATQSTMTFDDLMMHIEELKALKLSGSEFAERLRDLLDATGLNLGDSTSNLSALQQGIQGITEDTASALEAYMNGVSQQVYLHSTLLTEIRDAVVGFDLDVQSGTIGEILLQLQQSYQVQMSIESMLNGWNNASGRAIRVEMVS